jgi:cyclase
MASSFLSAAMRRVSVALWIGLALTPHRSSAQIQIPVTELAPQLLLLAAPEGNMLVSVGPDGAFVVGVRGVSTTAHVSALIATRTQSSHRYVIISPQDSAHAQGDAGWGRLGAFVAVHENALRRLGSQIAGVDRPHISFSDVLAIDLNGESIHVVHQQPGYSDADALTHFHNAGVVYLGEAYPGDGYPLIDVNQGGTLDGLVKTLDPWAGSSLRIVPARGPVAGGTDVKAFRDMIVTVRERVRALVAAGRSVDQVIAARPTAEYDARWSRGRVTPEVFVREVYRAVAPR